MLCCELDVGHYLPLHMDDILGMGYMVPGERELLDDKS